MNLKQAKGTLIAFSGYIILVLVTFFIAACQSNKFKDSKPVITVSIMPQKYLAEKIAGDLFEIHVMIPADADPHNFDPTPRQIMKLANTELYLKIGYIDFELTWINKLIRDYPAIRFIDTSEGVELMDYLNSDCGHLHGNIEPHIWSSPRNVKVIAGNMTQAFISMDAENQELFLANLNKFELELDSLDQYITDNLADLTKRSFIIYHPALSYFARDYDLEQIAIESEGKESSVRHFRSIVNTAKENNIKAIFVQQQFNRDEAITLEKEIGGKIISIDPLAYDWKEQMIYITDQLANQLKP